jgi:hypothetical protein
MQSHHIIGDLIVSRFMELERYLIKLFSILIFDIDSLLLGLTDEDVRGSENFLLHKNMLMIKNISTTQSGNYSCIIQLKSSGAKLETPHKLVRLHGENINI